MTTILDHRGQPMPSVDSRRVHSMLRDRYHSALRARYDAAQTTAENEKHWAQADSLSARAASSPEVRRKLRERARYEVANDSYCNGMLRTKTIDVLGSVPRLAIQLPNRKAAADIAARWYEWASAIDLGAKMRLMYRSYLTDGESFALRTINDRLPFDSVQLDYRIYEADQVASPYLRSEGDQYLDGVHLNRNGEPIAYDVLDYHPGDVHEFYAAPADFRTYEAKREMIHLYRIDRPGQIRGVPHLTPALPLFAKRRRYALAVITAAETAANLAAVLYSEHTALTDADIAVLEDDAFFDLPRGSMPVLPMGYKLSQLKGEQPTETYEMFSREVLQEVSRCLGLPLIVAVANSQNANYASGRLDYQGYHQMIEVDRHWLCCQVLDLIFGHWLEEATRIPGYLPTEAFADRIPHKWFFDPKPHVDPEKEANAVIALWEKGLALDEDHFLRVLGRDPSEVYELLAEQQKRRKEHELPYPGQAEVMAREKDNADRVERFKKARARGEEQ